MRIGMRIKLFLYDSKNFIKKFFRSSLSRSQQLFTFLIKNSYHFSPIRTSAHLILWLTFIFITILVIWARFAVLEEVTTAPATVIPISQVLIVKNLTGGIIKKVIVQEGDIVVENQILGYLDPTIYLSALDEAHARSDTLKIKIARLIAETSNQPFIVPPHLTTSSKPLLISQIKAEKDLLQSEKKQLGQMQKNLALANQELKMTKPLVSKGAVSKVEILHLERGMITLKNQIDEFHSKLFDELAKAKGDLATLNAATLALQYHLDRTTLRSTIKGVIKQVLISTPGSVVPPGGEIMSIVPLGKELLVEARVKPSDIGFIHVGEPATVKITAFDYSIYGGLDGHVDKVSADTITDKQGNTYYIVRIKTSKNYLRTKENPLYIIPGMTATVSILTGKRTVLNYFLSPLLKIQENALRQR